jgi:Uma2 family endonuclease
VEVEISAVERNISTADELLQLPSGLGERFELVEGELLTMSPGGSLHGKVAARAALLLGSM